MDYICLFLLALPWIQNSQAEIYQYGNDLVPRNNTFEHDEVNVILHTDMGFPRGGNVIRWSTYTNGTGNVTFQIWRSSRNKPNTYSLIGFNTFSILTDGLQHLDVGDPETLEVQTGDIIGLTSDNSRIITYSVPPNGCPLKPYLLQAPFAPQIGTEYVFKDDQKRCMILPVRASVQSPTPPLDEQTTQYATEPSDDTAYQTTRRTSEMATSSLFELTTEGFDATTVTELDYDVQQPDIKLTNGRGSHEGIVLIRPPNFTEWLLMCDNDWGDQEADDTCRTLGYPGGIAKYFPFFGHLSPPHSDRGIVSCRQSQSLVADCRIWDTANKTSCHHGHHAAVECTIRNIDASHVFGYPAVARNQVDERTGVNVIIPHPHHTMPWTSGTIREWVFYLATDITNGTSISFQIWRKVNESFYKFVGETLINDMKSGAHSKELSGSDERIHFEAGDVIGIRFEGANPIPFDVHPEPCEKASVVDIVDISSSSTDVPLIRHQIYPFTSAVKDVEDCKLYSLYAVFTGSERFGSHVFSLDRSLYNIMTSSVTSWDGADEACAREMGNSSALVDINTESEFSRIIGVLNSMNIHEELWIGNTVGSAHGEGYRQWAHCHPRRGQSCVYLGRRKEDEYFDDSGDLFFMYTDECETRRAFLCEKSSVKVVRKGKLLHPGVTHDEESQLQTFASYNVTQAQYRNQYNDVVSHKMHKNGVSSVIIAPLTTAIILFSIVFVLAAIHLYRKQKRKHSRVIGDSESTVRFVSLYDKAALSSLDC